MSLEQFWRSWLTGSHVYVTAAGSRLQHMSGRRSWWQLSWWRGRREWRITGCLSCQPIQLVDTDRQDTSLQSSTGRTWTGHAAELEASGGSWAASRGGEAEHVWCSRATCSRPVMQLLSLLCKHRLQMLKLIRGHKNIVLCSLRALTDTVWWGRAVASYTEVMSLVK